MKTLVVTFSEVTATLLGEAGHERVILLTTDKFKADAEALAESNPDRYVVRHVRGNVVDPAEWFKEISAVVQHEKAHGHSVEIDVTGGNKPMSLGAYAAAEFHGLKAAYLVHEIPRRNGASSKAPPHREPPRVIGYKEVFSVREELDLDMVASADNAYRFGRFDVAAALYERVNKDITPRATFLARLSKARQAWLDGHYVVARDELRAAQIERPQPWDMVADALSPSGENEPPYPFELSPTIFAAWLKDRRHAIAVRRKGGQWPTDVARDAWLLIEELAKRVLATWIRNGATLRRGSSSLAADALREMTVGQLFQLICDKRCRDDTVEQVSAQDEARFVSLCTALRGAELPKVRGRRRFEGIEIRNRIAHGGANLQSVESWLRRVLGDEMLLDQLIQACMPPGVSTPEPSPLEDPERISQRLAG